MPPQPAQLKLSVVIFPGHGALSAYVHWKPHLWYPHLRLSSRTSPRVFKLKCITLCAGHVIWTFSDPSPRLITSYIGPNVLPPQASLVFPSFPITFTQCPKPETGNPPGCMVLTSDIWCHCDFIWRLLHLTCPHLQIMSGFRPSLFYLPQILSTASHRSPVCRLPVFHLITPGRALSNTSVSQAHPD